MEIYFNNLTADEGPAGKLVEDLMRLTYDAEDLVKAAGSQLAEQQKRELAAALGRLQASCRTIQKAAKASARATDRMIRQHPFSSVGIALGAGLLIGLLVKRV